MPAGGTGEHHHLHMLIEHILTFLYETTIYTYIQHTLIHTPTQLEEGCKRKRWMCKFASSLEYIIGHLIYVGLSTDIHTPNIFIWWRENLGLLLLWQTWGFRLCGARTSSGIGCKNDLCAVWRMTNTGIVCIMQRFVQSWTTAAFNWQ